jgi:hypothetical protein
MTKQGLEILLEQVSTWPDKAQEALLNSMSEIEKKFGSIYQLDDEERAAVRTSLREMKEKKFAPDDEVSAVFSRYRA